MDYSCDPKLDVEVERQPDAPSGGACLNSQNSTHMVGRSWSQDPAQQSYEFEAGLN